MNYTDSLKEAKKIQGINLKTDEIPITIYMKNNGDILQVCFIEKETINHLIIIEIMNQGEQIRIIPKNNIEYRSIHYFIEEEEKIEHINLYQ